MEALLPMSNISKILLLVTFVFIFYSIDSLLITKINGDSYYNMYFKNSALQLPHLLEIDQRYLYYNTSNINDQSVFPQSSNNMSQNYGNNKNDIETEFDLCYNSIPNIYNTSECNIVPPPPPLNYTRGK
jgi:hypothetical protein